MQSQQILAKKLIYIMNTWTANYSYFLYKIASLVILIKTNCQLAMFINPNTERYDVI